MKGRAAFGYVMDNDSQKWLIIQGGIRSDIKTTNEVDQFTIRKCSLKFIRSICIYVCFQENNSFFSFF
jgi:hypothetical protein